MCGIVITQLVRVLDESTLGFSRSLLQPLVCLALIGQERLASKKKKKNKERGRGEKEGYVRVGSALCSTIHILKGSRHKPDDDHYDNNSVVSCQTADDEDQRKRAKLN